MQGEAVTEGQIRHESNRMRTSSHQLMGTESRWWGQGWGGGWGLVFDGDRGSVWGDGEVLGTVKGWLRGSVSVLVPLSRALRKG